MMKHGQSNSIQDDTRPRIAIVGGGGAMGRLFAQLLSGAAREIQLYDYFGSTARAANLSLTLTHVRGAGAGSGRTAPIFGINRDKATSVDGASRGWVTATVESDTVRGLVMAGSASSDDGGSSPNIDGGTLADVIDREAGAHPRSCVVFAGLPEDAPGLLPRADITLLAIGFENPEAYREALRAYVPWLRSGSLVVDLGSTKTGPMQVLAQEVSRDVGVLGAHPLFGPTVSDVTGLIVAAVEPDDGRPDSPWKAWFLEQLTRLRMLVTSTSAVEHDDAMAFVQSLTHFALLTFAYTFVRVDRDPNDLLVYRTPVFEPLLYLAARVANLARNSPDTYRSIQALSTRPDVRREFVAAARDILAAIERVSDPAATSSDGSPDPLTEIFRQFGGPWSPDGRDRRDRQRREHFLEMGVHLVDNLNRLRQDVVASVGQVRAVEERRSGLSPRIVVGIVDVDLLDPGKYDVASQIRLKRLNLPLGSVRRVRRDGVRVAADDAHDEIVPLARARLLTDGELLEWLYQSGQLVERRSFDLIVPVWFDQAVVLRMIKGLGKTGQGAGSQVWHVELNEAATGRTTPQAHKIVAIDVAIVIHPSELVALRNDREEAQHRLTSSTLERIDQELADVRARLANPVFTAERAQWGNRKDALKHERKALIDRRTSEIDREVRRAARSTVQRIADTTLAWLLEHGCSVASWSSDAAESTEGLRGGSVSVQSGDHNEAR